MAAGPGPVSECASALAPRTVLESGTGSGSLTSSLARAVAPTGHVHTFEFHEQRADLAREDFAANGMSSLITVRQRDIEGGGFPDDLHGAADAVFLDLPGPWKVVPSVAKCLRPDGVFCGFSPCIEQVKRRHGPCVREWGLGSWRSAQDCAGGHKRGRGGRGRWNCSERASSKRRFPPSGCWGCLVAPQRLRQGSGQAVPAFLRRPCCRPKPGVGATDMRSPGPQRLPLPAQHGGAAAAA